MTTATNCPHCGANRHSAYMWDCGSPVSGDWKSEECEKEVLILERHALKAQNERLREALKRIVSCVPAMHEGSLIYEHYTPDGEYAGTQLVDPLSVVQEMDHIAHEALAKEVAND
jgi:hypothetical protein